MNEFDRARLQRDKKRYISDGNRTITEGSRPDPRYCHEYAPRKTVSPELAVRIEVAMGKMECQLSPENKVSG